MWYLFGILYFAIGFTIGVVELRTRQKYEPADSNRLWWVLPVHLFFWLPMLIFCTIVVTIEKIKRL